MMSTAKKLYASEKTVNSSVHEDNRYKSYVIKRGQFVLEKSKENRINRSKIPLNKLKYPAEVRMDFW